MPGNFQQTNLPAIGGNDVGNGTFIDMLNHRIKAIETLC
jgi:hypothetical protein